MNTAANKLFVLTALALIFPVHAQVPVDDDGNEIGTGYSTDSEALLLSNAELEELVAPIALYPDELLAIVLPASTYPLQIVEAARFLEAVETDPSLEPDEDWDDSIVALLNYPEVVELLNEDLDWTWSLGEAVVAQQPDVLTAVDSFRDRAYAAGNLRTDDYQVVEENDDGIIEISPVSEDVIYVPYYEPERVVVYQTEPVYRYYARPYPVYYYPYPVSYVHYGPFWGVTTAFSIGWVTNSLHVWHHSYYGHPYYGRYYRDYWWYRRPALHVHNSIYYGGHTYSRRHYRYGDYWRPRVDRRHYSRDQRITRSRYYSGNDRRRTERTTSSRREAYSRSGPNRSGTVGQAQRDRRDRVAADNRRRDTATRTTTRGSDAASRSQRSQRDRVTSTGNRSDATRRAGSSEQRRSNSVSPTRRPSSGSAERGRDQRASSASQSGNREQRSVRRGFESNSNSLRTPRGNAQQSGTRQRVERSNQVQRSTRTQRPRQQQYASAGRSRVERSAAAPRRSTPTVRRAPQTAAAVPQARPQQRYAAPRPQSRSSAPAPKRSSAPAPKRSSGAERRAPKSDAPSRSRSSSQRGQSVSRERRR